MRACERLVGAVVVCCVAALVGLPAGVLADGTSSLGVTGAPSSGAGSQGSEGSLDSLVIPGMQGLVGAQQLQAQEEALRANPEAVAARRASRTAFEGLSAARAAQVASEAFPAVIDEQAGGPPKLPTGQTIAGFSSDHVAQVDLPGGKRGVIESLAPMATETSSGQRVPLDLSLSEIGDGFQPTTPAVKVRIPKRLSEGVLLPESGVTLIPVVAGGSSLGGSQGVADGDAVLYANTEVDTDTVIKPAALGVDADAILRSVASPQQLSFHVGLPAGGSLVQAKSGTVRILDEGTVIASVLPPSAHDAAGTAVPVSMSASGNTLTVSVDHLSGEYQYPIEVDPEVIDGKLSISPGNWFFGTTTTKFISVPGTNSFSIQHSLAGGEFSAGQYAFDQYQTQGRSHIYAFTGTVEEYDPHAITTSLRIENPAKVRESPEVILPVTTRVEEIKTSACPSTCAPEAVTEGNKHNAVILQDAAIETANWEFSSGLYKAQVKIEQEAAPTASYDYADQTINGKPNANYFPGAKQWVNGTTGVIGALPGDPGIGVNEVAIKSSGTPSWGHGLQSVAGCYGAQCNECWNWTSKCAAGESSSGEPWTYSLSGLPEGSNHIELQVENATGATSSQEEYVQIDNLPPHNIVLNGLPSGNKIGDAFYHLSAEATDGSGSTASSGVASIAMKIDGQEIGKPSGSCSPGPCTVTSSTVTIGGAEYGVGQHTLTIVATDKVGNTATESVTFTVQHAAHIGVGPGSLNPVTGEFDMSANDVSISGGSSGLAVSRNYNSRNLTMGMTGPLGPQWSMSIGGEEYLVKLANGGVTVTSATGGQTTFATNGSGGFISPNGDANLSLSETESKEKIKEYLLKDAADGATTRFTLPSGGGTVWTPTIQEGLVVTNTLTYVFQTVEVAGVKITEPTEALAPVPAGVSCAPKLEKGCRALTFSYAASTTATGETQSTWGDYQGRLKQVLFTAWNPAEKEMKTTAVAQYAYDKQGRLRAEWNPGISPALKTVYGYDSENHVTALTAPGQESWVLHYGALASDPTNTGRLLSAAHPSKSGGSPWNGVAPANTAVPTVSSSAPVEGTTVSASSNGTWSNGPVGYSYQWENCWAKVCHAIPGATNSSFTPTSAYVNQALVVQVTATNAGGSTTATSIETSKIVGIVPTYSLEFGKGTLGTKVTSEYALYAGATADAVDSSGNVWVANSSTTSSKVYVFGSTGSLLHSYAVEGVATGIAINQSSGEVYVADAKGNAIQELSSAGVSLGKISLSRGGGSGANWISVAVDSSGNIWTSNYGSGYVEEFNSSSKFVREIKVSEPEGLWEEHPVGVAVGGERVYVAVTSLRGGTTKGWEYTYSGALFKELEFNTVGVNFVWEPDNGFLYSLKGTSAYEYLPSNASKQSEETCQGNCEAPPITKFGSEKLGEALDLAVDASSHFLYVVDNSKGEVEKWTAPHPEYLAPAPPSAGGNSVWTVDYNVPVSGAGAPHEMTTKELERWAQKDDPTEATAVFPPDEPMGWPAKDFTRATIDYRDSAGRTVNVASPSGAISTTEYNMTNDVVRTLSPDNRAVALAEGSKSAEGAQQLDSQSTYNAEGTQMQSGLGPQHVIKLASGSEVKARERTTYHYNEGAPTEGGPYNLPTKVTEAAQLSGGEEVEPRTTSTSYSGQENLGWKLRKPTSVTTDPGGLNIVHTTVYEPTTGKVVETRSPKGSGGESHAAPVFAFQFGSEGIEEGKFRKPMSEAFDGSGNLWVVDSGNDRVQEFSTSGALLKKFGTEGVGAGQFKSPWGIAINKSTGNMYVSDYTNDRVEEFSSSGTFIRTFGFGVSNNGKEEFEICTTGCVAGKAGSGNGQFSSPLGVAIDSAGNVWVVDEHNARVEEFNEKGEYLSKFGSLGSGNGQMHEPAGIAIADGNLYVAEYNNSRVQEFSSKGIYVSQFGSKGTGNGQFEGAEGITADPISGDLYVTDFGNGRVEEFTINGAFLATFGSKGIGAQQFKGPEGVAVNNAGAVYVSDTENNRVQEWEPIPTASIFSAQFGTKGKGNGQFEEPRGAAIDSGGNVWVVDTENSRLEKFSATGTFLAAYGTHGTGAGQLSGAAGITINQATGNIYVSDRWNMRVEEFSSSGVFIRTFGWGVTNGKAEFEVCTTTCQKGLEGAGNGEFHTPLGLTVDSGGNVWVADYGNSRIEEFPQKEHSSRRMGHMARAMVSLSGRKRLCSTTAISM